MIVILESPFETGDAGFSRIYAIECCVDSFKRGETPLAGHLLYPQIVDDITSKDLRETVNDAIFQFYIWAKKIVFYLDHGWTDGMRRARARAENLGYVYEERYLFDQQQKRSEPDDS